jgi:hypothetical protein
MAHRKLKSDRKNHPGGALQLRLRQYSERPSGPLGQLEPFLNNLTMKYTPNIRGRCVQWMLLERVLAQWQCLVAFRKALDLLYQAMHAV